MFEKMFTSKTETQKELEERNEILKRIRNRGEKIEHVGEEILVKMAVQTEKLEKIEELQKEISVQASEGIEHAKAIKRGLWGSLIHMLKNLIRRLRPHREHHKAEKSEQETQIPFPKTDDDLMKTSHQVMKQSLEEAVKAGELKPEDLQLEDEANELLAEIQGQVSTFRQQALIMQHNLNKDAKLTEKITLATDENSDKVQYGIHLVNSVN